MKMICLTLTLFALTVISLQAAEKPNIVLILADDLGWSDTTLYGNTKFYQTPNVERLAKRGTTFTKAYSASPLCSPTRASLMTGLHPARIGITTPACHLPEVRLTATIKDRVPSPRPEEQPVSLIPISATRLNTTYTTLAETLKKAGYVTSHFGKWHLGREPYSPLEQGFDTDIPHWFGPGPAGSYVAPWKFPNFTPDENVPNQHIEDRIAKEASLWIEKHKDEPFFLNYWMFSVHAPFDAKKDLIEKHKKRVDPNNSQRSPTYAAMIESMDDAIGTLLDTLERLKIADKTIIIFYSDNGGNMYSEIDETVPTSNFPLRGGKGTVFDGGIRVPCVVVWHGVIEAASRSEQIIQSTDIYPTLLEILGLPPEPNQKFDGISIVPALKGKTLERDAIFTYFPHQTNVPDWLPPAVAIHSGDWKLIRVFYAGQNGNHRWLLFNLHDDPGEKNNLAEQKPELVKKLDAKIENFLKDTNAVLPLPNPNFNPALFDWSKIGISTPRAKNN
jgi:arylsulfatase A-like enzyme